MFEIASQMTMCLLIAGLFGFIIGYLSSNKECVEHHINDDYKLEEAEAKAKVEQEAKEKEEAEAKAKAEQEAKEKEEAEAKAKEEQEEKEKEEAEAKAKVEQEAKEKEEAEAKAKVEQEVNDDLTRIKGLGQKTQTTLNSLGINTFEQIALWTKDDVDMVNTKISVHGKSNRASWIKQAKSFVEESIK